MLEWFLSTDDASRAERVLRKLGQHDIGSWALTGGLAIEIHHGLRGHTCSTRPLNDIDFIAASFDCLPESLGRDFLFRHVHPFDPLGKTILQAIDPDEALRIDVFRANGAVIDRALEVHLANVSVGLISLEDLVARTARLVMDLVAGIAVPAKHVRDFLRLMRLIDAMKIETTWREHRRLHHPVSFVEAEKLLQEMIPIRQDLLITPQYSTVPHEICQRCAPTFAFKLADRNAILSLLGYC